MPAEQVVGSPADRLTRPYRRRRLCAKLTISCQEERTMLRTRNSIPTLIVSAILHFPQLFTARQIGTMRNPHGTILYVLLLEGARPQ